MSRTLLKFETACRLGGAALLLFAATAGFAQQGRRHGAPLPATSVRDRGGSQAGGGANRLGGEAAGRGNGNASSPHVDGDRRDGGGSALPGDRNSGIGEDATPPDNRGGPMRKGGEEIGSRAPAAPAAPLAPVTSAKGAAVGGKGGAADHGSIDLVRPDDGYGNYANLRRRAARGSAVVHDAKKPPAVPQLNLATHAPPETSTVVPQTRNALGIVTNEGGRHAPALPLPRADRSTAPVMTTPGVELHPVPRHVEPSLPDGRTLTGINGTTMGRVAASGGIGGPAKNRTGVNGTSLRPK